MFLKEMVYKSGDVRTIQNAFRLIKDLRKRYNQRQNEKKELEVPMRTHIPCSLSFKDLVQQEDLILNKRGPSIRLNDLYARPNFGVRNKKVQGNLEAHSNGFRFTSRRNDKLDILYRFDCWGDGCDLTAGLQQHQACVLPALQE